MDLTEIQNKQNKFILDRKWDRFSVMEIFTHIIEELGEVGSHLLYQSGYKVKGAGHEGEKDNISTEIAQVFNLFLQLCIQVNVDLQQAWIDEYEKNVKRFDPELWKKLADEAKNNRNI